MAKTALSILQAVTGELGFIQPTEVFASTNTFTIQLRSLLVAACDELADAYDWQRLIKTTTVTTVADQTEYDRPTDLLRELPITHWDRSAVRPQGGNTSPAIWEQYQSAAQPVGSPHSFRIAGNKLVVFPPPAANQTLAYQYITKNYVIDANNGLLKDEFTNDGDMTVFHDRCLINLLKLKVLQIKGLDTRAAAEDFNSSLEAAKGGDTPAPLLTLVQQEVELGYEHLLPDVVIQS